MDMIDASVRFHGTVLDLIGKNLAEIRDQLPPFETTGDAGGMERVSWPETILNQDTGESVPIHLILLVRDGVIVQLAIQADRYVFRVRSRPGAEPWLVACPKEPGCGPEEANWIREQGGNLVNQGVE